MAEGQRRAGAILPNAYILLIFQGLRLLSVVGRTSSCSLVVSPAGSLSHCSYSGMQGEEPEQEDILFPGLCHTGAIRTVATQCLKH